MGRFSLLRRNDRTTQPGSQPLDSCGGLRGTYNLEPLGSFLPEGSLGVPRHQPPHALQLNPSRPDGSLRLESVDHVYAIFLHLVPFYFPEREREAERRKLQCSRCRILELSYRLPGEGAGEGGEREFMNYDL